MTRAVAVAPAAVALLSLASRGGPGTAAWPASVLGSGRHKLLRLHAAPWWTRRAAGGGSSAVGDGRSPSRLRCSAAGASSTGGQSGDWKGASRSHAGRQDTELHAAATDCDHAVEGTVPAAVGLGRLELIIGPMFAGKTSELLQRVRGHEAEGKRVLLIKSGIDDRYSKHEVVTHDGVRQACYTVTELSQLQSAIGSDALQEAQVIAIDEAQFFTDLHEFCVESADVRHQIVLVAGLSGDFRRRPFGHINDLLSKADRVTQLSATCNFCSPASPAIFTLRVVADERTEVIGGADKYVPVCRHHYNSLSVKALSGRRPMP